MAIENRDLKAGTVLKASHKGKTYSCIVRDPKKGPRLYVVQDLDSALAPAGECKSLSKAASVVMGAKSSAGINGWSFWSRAADFVAGNGQKPRPKATKKATAKKAPAARKPVVARRSDKPAEERKAFACGECGQEYNEQDDANACLDAHRAQAQQAQEPEPQAVEA